MSGCPDCTPTKLCKWHKRRAEAKQPKPIRRTPLKKKVYKIKRESNKRAKENRLYRIEVAEWKLKNTRCKARLKGCTGRTQHNHHKKGKEGALLLIKKYWFPVCGNCHDIIGEMPIEEAIAGGFSERRNVEISQRIK